MSFMREVILVFSVEAGSEIDAKKAVETLLAPTSPPARYERLQVEKGAPGFFEVRCAAYSAPLSSIEHAMKNQRSILSLRAL